MIPTGIKTTGLICWPAVALLCLAPMLAVLSAVPIDETRYLSVAWEMRQSGDWIQLHLNGQPYFDKPPLLFWLINLMWSTTGVSVWSARLGVLLCGAGCVALIRSCERLLAGTNGNADALLAGTLFFALFCSVVMFDVLLSLCVVMAFLAMLRYVLLGQRGALWLLFTAAALGMLAKGPVMLLHLLGPIALAPWWVRKERSGWRVPMTMLVVALLGGLPVLGWALFALKGLSMADAHELLLRQTAGRVVESFAHNRPVWWYLPLVPILLTPWWLVWRWTSMRRLLAPTTHEIAGRFALCATVPALLGFSVVSGKQIHYLLPLLPGMALMLSHWQRNDPMLFPVGRWWIPILLSIVILAWSVTHGIRAEHAAWLQPLSGTFMLLAACMVLAQRRWPVPMASTWIALLLAAAMLPLLRFHVIDGMNPEPLAQRVAQLQRDGVPIARTSNEPGMLTFLARMQAPLAATSDPAAWGREHPFGFVLGHSGHGSPPVSAQQAIKLANGWTGLVPSADSAALTQAGKTAQE